MLDFTGDGASRSPKSIAFTGDGARRPKSIAFTGDGASRSPKSIAFTEMCFKESEVYSLDGK